MEASTFNLSLTQGAGRAGCHSGLVGIIIVIVILIIIIVIIVIVIIIICIISVTLRAPPWEPLTTQESFRENLCKEALSMISIAIWLLQVKL